MAISNRVGPPVTGDDFYGRTKELTLAHGYLNSRHSLVLSAPRRIGKSSFAKKIIEEKKAQNWTCVYIDLEGVQTRDEFLGILIKTFEKSGIWAQAASVAGGVVNKIIESIKEIGPIKLDFTKRDELEHLYSSLAEAMNHNKDTLIVIDELTLFLGSLARSGENLQEISFLLNWFRSLRQVTESKIRWIFCGSIGLHNFTSLHNLSMTINDLLPFDFDALTQEEAKGLIKELASTEDIKISEKSLDYFLSKIVWPIPYFIQLMFKNIRRLPDARNGITESSIDKAFEMLVSSEILSTWSERLGEYYKYEEIARALLNELCKSDDGIAKNQLLAIAMPILNENHFTTNNLVSTTLNMLERDGYIIRSAGGVRRFRSPLLKQWWSYHFVE